MQSSQPSHRGTGSQHKGALRGLAKLFGVVCCSLWLAACSSPTTSAETKAPVASAVPEIAPTSTPRPAQSGDVEPTATAEPSRTATAEPSPIATAEPETFDATITVELDGSGDFDNLEQAIELASSDATILIGAGFHPVAGLRINKPVTIVGAGSGPGGTMLEASGDVEAPAIAILDTAVAMSALRVRTNLVETTEARHPVVWVRDSAIAFNDVAIQDGSGDGLLLRDSAGSVANGFFVRNEWSGLSVRGETEGDLVLNDNVSVENKVGFSWYDTASGSATNNQANFNTEAGYVIRDQATPVLEDNKASRNAGAGFR